MTWALDNVRLCLSCIVTVIICTLIAILVDPINALFVLCISSVVISGNSNDNKGLRGLSTLMAVFWFVNLISYHLIIGNKQLIETYPYLISAYYLVPLLTNFWICVTSLELRRHWIMTFAGAMVSTAFYGVVTGEIMPVMALGNTLFVLQCIAFVAASYSTNTKTIAKDKPKVLGGSVVKFEARNGRSRRSFT